VTVPSVLDPAGAVATRIAELAWVLFGGGAAILLLVLLATALALRGPPWLRAGLAQSRFVGIAGLGVPAVVLTVLLGYGVALTGASGRTPSEMAATRIEITGEQWWWRITYETAGRRFESANELRMPVGRPVDLTLKSADVIHSFWVPSLAGKMDMIPGRQTRLHLSAAQPGVFRGQCAEYCGGAHALMALEVIAMPAGDFDAWLGAEAEPAAPGARRAPGEDLFLAVGCGACHSIRGTTAAGRIGPDLTHVGGRRTIGGALLPLTGENLARFIVDGQHLKPGNAMPPFRIFAAAELDSLTAYLLELR
jgi:cytochrome c oxidase subunit II